MIQKEFEWESLYSNYIDKMHFAYTDRAKVIGGWIVNSRTCAGNKGHESMVFVPDPNHEWKLDLDYRKFDYSKCKRCDKSQIIKDYCCPYCKPEEFNVDEL